MPDRTWIPVPLEEQARSFHLTARDLRVAIETGAPVLPDVAELAYLAAYTRNDTLRENIYSTIEAATGLPCRDCTVRSCDGEDGSVTCPLLTRVREMALA